MPARSITQLAEAVYQSRWLSPDGEQVFSPGCLYVRDGLIQKVWAGIDSAALDLGNVALVPGLINAHTHLEFSDLAQPLAPGAAFPDWIRTVIQSRRQRTGDSGAAIRRGWQESQSAGTAAVGEIATSDDAFGVLAAEGTAGVVFREVLGLQEEAVERGLETAQRFLECVTPCTDSGREGVADIPPALRCGLSPHAPYSLHPRLFRGLVDLAAAARVPVAMHLAETREELELLAQHSGGLVELLTSLGLWGSEAFDDFGRPLDYLRELSRCERTLVVHGNYLDKVELDFLASQPQMSVVYCPRTHAAFGHAPHPWLEMQSRGIRVVLGTDSRASNPDLSLVGELRFLQQHYPDVSDQTLLRMVTADAAAALGLGRVLGTLEPGKLARFTVISPAKQIRGAEWPGLWG